MRAMIHRSGLAHLNHGKLKANATVTVAAVVAIDDVTVVTIVAVDGCYCCYGCCY